MHRGASQAIIHGIAKGRTQLSNHHSLNLAFKGPTQRLVPPLFSTFSSLPPGAHCPGRVKGPSCSFSSSLLSHVTFPDYIALPSVQTALNLLNHGDQLAMLTY